MVQEGMGDGGTEGLCTSVVAIKVLAATMVCFGCFSALSMQHTNNPTNGFVMSFCCEQG